MSHVRDVVSEISTHHPAEVFRKRGIDVIFGSPRFIGPNKIEVDGNKKIEAKKFIICTGSHPAVPPINGLKDIEYLTNENVFDLDKLPGSLIVLGGGPIGVEVSQALSRLGVKVFIVEMLDRILIREDKEVVAVLEKKLRDEGIKILTGKKAIRFKNIDGQVCATLEDKNGNHEELYSENVLVAVGRIPNLEELSLKKAKVEYNKKGVKVNSYLQTTNENIFACGDVVGPFMFSHVAAYQASICVRNALFKRIAWQKVNYQNIAWATFTDPELAHLGLSEDEANEQYGKVKVYKSEYINSDRAITDLHKEGLIKIITDNKGCILGAHIVGSQASELIQGFLLAKSLKVPLSKIAQTLFIYPTLSELVKKTAAKSLIEKLGNPVVKIFMKLLRKV